MLVVGLTGGIASGKSTAAQALAVAGAPVVSSDALAREAVAPGGPTLGAIVRRFGPQVRTASGDLDRRALAGIVFGNPEARRDLEAITHPEIRERMLRWLAQRRAEGAPAAVCEIPLLFEVGLHLPGTFLDRIWVVRVDPDVQRRRLLARDRLTDLEARGRLDAQWPPERKAAAADRVFDNNGSPEELTTLVVTAWRELLGAPGSGGG